MIQCSKRNDMNKERRIAILDLYYGQSGKLGFYNIQSLGLAKAYVNQGHEVYVVRPEKTISVMESQEFAHKITIVNVPAKTFGVHSFYDLNFLVEKKIDLVHLNSDNQAYAPSVMNFCKKHKIDLYNYVGTLYSDTQNVLKKLIMNFFSERNIRYYKKYKTFVKTESVLTQLREKGVCNAKVVPVGLDIEIIPEILISKEETRKQLGLPLDKKILLYVGRLAEYKKPMDALELLSMLPEEYYLVAIGSGELKENFLEKIDSLRLNDRISYIEKIPNKEIHNYYRTADCFVNFNTQEIFGMSILEALYQECPVIAKHAPGPDFIVANGETGFLCDTLEQMRESVTRIEPSMGVAGRKQVEEKFTWEVASRALLED